jgi:hypothetical protein
VKDFEITTTSVVQPVAGAAERGAVDVAADPDVQRHRLRVAERVERQHRPQFRTADADGDDGAERRAGGGFDVCVMNGPHKGLHFGVRGPAFVLMRVARIAGRAHGGVHRGAAFADVDDLAPRHALQEIADPGLFGKRLEADQHLGRDALAGIIDVQIAEIERQAFGAPGVGGEQIGQRRVLRLTAQLLEGFPGGGFGNKRHGHLYQKPAPGATLETPCGNGNEGAAQLPVVTPSGLPAMKNVSLSGWYSRAATRLASSRVTASMKPLRRSM